jgi:hypothetical protein
MTSGHQKLQAFLDSLHSRGWHCTRETTRFFVYGPPPSESPRSSYELLVPRDPAAMDFSRALDNCIAAFASFLELSISNLDEALLPSSEIISLGFDGDGYRAGAAPFPQFERMVEHLKRGITRAAAFVITDDPITQATPTAARTYLDDCWFMQTMRGSFVARVALPATGDFRQPLSLFSRPIERSAVPLAIRGVADLVGNRVLKNDQSLFTDEGFESVRPLVSVGVLEEFAKLLRGSSASRVHLKFSRPEDRAEILLPNLGEEQHDHLDFFIEHVRQRLLATFDLEAVGRVIEVRRRGRRSSRSMVGVSALVEGRTQYITFGVEPELLPSFLEYFRTGELLEIRGRARRLRTQLRIEANLSYSTE